MKALCGANGGVCLTGELAKAPTTCARAHLPFKCWPLGRGRPHSAPRHERASLAGRTNRTHGGLLTKLWRTLAGPLPIYAEPSPHAGAESNRGSETAGCAPPDRGGLRRNAEPRPPGGAPIRLACLFLTLQLASSPSSSRQTDPAADWSASSWYEPPWPISACQSTSQAHRKRLESPRPVKMGGKWAWWRRARLRSCPALRAFAA